MSDKLTQFVKWYGYGGLIPFIGLTVLTVLQMPLPWELKPGMLFKYWSAIILSFMAAIIWGLALFVPDVKEKPALTVAVLLAILGWIALLLPKIVALPLLIACYLLLWRFEQTNAFKRIYSNEYRKLRSILTTVVVACHGVVWIAI